MRCHTAWVEKVPGRHVTVERVDGALFVKVTLDDGERVWARLDIRGVIYATPSLEFIIRGLVKGAEGAIAKGKERYPILDIEAMVRAQRGLATLDKYGQVPADWRAKRRGDVEEKKG